MGRTIIHSTAKTKTHLYIQLIWVSHSLCQLSPGKRNCRMKILWGRKSLKDCPTQVAGQHLQSSPSLTASAAWPLPGKLCTSCNKKPAASTIWARGQKDDLPCSDHHSLQYILKTTLDPNSCDKTWRRIFPLFWLTVYNQTLISFAWLPSHLKWTKDWS